MNYRLRSRAFYANLKTGEVTIPDGATAITLTPSPVHRGVVVITWLEPVE